MRKKIFCCFLVGLTGLFAFAQRQMENLDRGVVAVRGATGKVFVSWRLLATDPNDMAFNVYRTLSGKTQKLNSSPIKNVTGFTDPLIDTTSKRSYQIKAVLKGKETETSKPFILKPGHVPYFSIPLQTPEGYTANDGSAGDLDGDGAYELVIHMTGRSKDNSQAGITDPPIIHAYTLDGRLLWSINLGKNIREGAHYTQFIVYDLDGDGRAELAMKTADGSV